MHLAAVPMVHMMEHLRVLVRVQMTVHRRAAQMDGLKVVPRADQAVCQSEHRSALPMVHQRAHLMVVLKALLKALLKARPTARPTAKLVLMWAASMASS